MRILFALFTIKNCFISAVIYAMLAIKLEPLSDGYYVIAITTLSVVIVGLTWSEMLLAGWILKNLDKKGVTW